VEYISVHEVSKKWGISERRIQKLCEENRIDGVLRFGRSWAIPKDTIKPIDKRIKKNSRPL
jgi:excisionase family DNA binding protein